MKAETDRDREAYWRARGWLTYSVHELPSGVLDGVASASPADCVEMLRELEAFEALCRRLEINDHQEFIGGCRWHFEHYPHYLGRRRHFVDYATYTRDRHGPMRVPDPPMPPRWLWRP